MYKDSLVSVVIPSRNERFLSQTIKDLLEKSTGEIEIIAVLDGYWPEADEIIADPRVHHLYFPEARGMRNAINKGVALARGEYILKTDAHCMFAKGYDEALKRDCEKDWVVVPRRYALDPEKWEVIKNNPKYPIDYMYLSKDLHGEPWEEKNRDFKLQGKKIDDLMSAQGSSWFMRRDYFEYLELLDEERFGSFWQEFQEIGLKCWLSGGRVVVNKNTWYAHWHKPREVGRGYRVDSKEEGKDAATFLKNGWHKAKHDIDYLIKKFEPVPTW